MVYQSFVEPLDAIDNGIEQYDTPLAPRYKINTGKRISGRELDS